MKPKTSTSGDQPSTKKPRLDEESTKYTSEVKTLNETTGKMYRGCKLEVSWLMKYYPCLQSIKLGKKEV